ncbi:hypothetical protein CPLU01_11797 [Colletotrichum plurivorum]|uniref:Uncharacterized protein n=1 Tax=Colletotrichum plurivorum TaxID=2175906 RepID=A0A8H6K0X8_9PEZI|nr:hypothetical protein CPLU01_11797 [Colletotrichum plurivorum]
MAVTHLTIILESCFRPPDGTSWTAGDDVSEHYYSWGFTIYRTAYGPSTDAQWHTLLDKIRAQVASEIECYDAGEEEVVAKLKSLFVLDACSDATLLADKTMHELREVHKRRNSSNDDDNNLPLMRDGPTERAFLLADAEVLEGVDRDPYFWVKCVEADFTEEGLAEAARGARSRAAFAAGVWTGWMKMTTRSVVDLCAEMPFRDLASIAPRTMVPSERPVYNGELTGSSLTSKMSSGR